jgi:hypothetical protein
LFCCACAKTKKENKTNKAGPIVLLRMRQNKIAKQNKQRRSHCPVSHAPKEVQMRIFHFQCRSHFQCPAQSFSRNRGMASSTIHVNNWATWQPAAEAASKLHPGALALLRHNWPHLLQSLQLLVQVVDFQQRVLQPLLGFLLA